MSAFRVLDFSAAATDSIWALTAAILHLGNLDIFLDENDSASIRNVDLVDKIAKLLGVSNNELSEALLTRVIAASGEVINQNDGF